MSEPAATSANGVPPPAPAAEPPKPAPSQHDAAFAALAAKERDLVRRQQAFTTERDAFLKEREGLLTLKQREEQRRQTALRNPEPVAKELWGDDWYEKLTEYRLNGAKITPDLVAASVEERLNAWDQRHKDEQEKQAAQEKERLQQEQQQTIDDFRTQATDFVKGKAEEYELINLHNWHPEVYRTIEQHYSRTAKEGTPKILSFKEAADLVEADLRERVEKSLGAKAFKDKYIAAKAPPQPQGEPKRETSAQPRTLSNDAFPASSIATHPEGASYLSEEERFKRAIAAGEAARRK